MKKVTSFMIVATTLLVASCQMGGQSRDDLRKENDSLSLALTQRNAELDEIMGTFNEIQEGFRLINEAENRVDLHRNTDENSATVRQKIADDVRFISQTMKENRERLAQLEKQLKSSKTQSAQLKKAIESLQQELANKTRRIEELQNELEAKNVRIRELDEAVANLNSSVASLTADNENKTLTVAEQEKAINTAWIVFGTKSELKNQKILKNGDVLKDSDFNKEYFTEVDIRRMKELKLYSKSAKLLTTHPTGSYELSEDEKGQKTLVIKNAKDFWSVSRYLVIQVR